MASVLITSQVQGGIVRASSSSKSRGSTSRNEQLVYVAAMALRGSRGPGQLLLSTAYSLRFWDLQHFMVLVKPAADSEVVHVYDFQPKDPEHVYVALAALSGGAVPGAVWVRKVRNLPRRRCWFVGTSTCEKAVEEAAADFNRGWHTDLRIGHHDCRHYTDGLVEHLTGHKQVLQSLRRGYGYPWRIEEYKSKINEGTR